MRKTIRPLLISALLILMLFPVNSFAEKFDVTDQDMSISIDTPEWTVFTRDNLNDQKDLLKKLGTTPKQMKSTMNESNAFIVAIKNKQAKREEVLVRIHKNKYINNMSTLSDKDLKALKNGIDEQYGGELDNFESTVRDLSGYKWFRMTGSYDKGHKVIQYITIINGKDYLVAAQKVVSYTDKDKSEFEGLVDGISFKVDSSLTENDLNGFIKDRQDLFSTSSGLPTKIFAGVIIALAVAAALYVKNRKHRRKRRMK